MQLPGQPVGGGADVEQTDWPSLISSAQRRAIASFSADAHLGDLGEGLVAVVDGTAPPCTRVSRPSSSELDQVAPDGGVTGLQLLGEIGHGGGAIGAQDAQRSTRDVGP